MSLLAIKNYIEHVFFFIFALTSLLPLKRFTMIELNGMNNLGKLKKRNNRKFQTGLA